MSNNQSIADQIASLSLLDAAELVKILEEKLGVSAAAPMMAAQAATSAPAAAAEAEKTEFDVIITDIGASKTNVIKEVRVLDPKLSIIDAKNLVEAAPKPVLAGVSKDKAEEAKAKLTAAGAKVEIK